MTPEYLTWLEVSPWTWKNRGEREKLNYLLINKSNNSIKIEICQQTSLYFICIAKLGGEEEEEEGDVEEE